jgi:hypothetical protein
MALLSDRIQDLIVLHRGLDNSDEDASNEEQGQKILYFYSAGGGVVDTVHQLSTVTMIESLLELVNKFSKTPIQSVVMHKKSWNFLEVEPSIWLAVSVLNDHAAASTTSQPQIYTTKGVDHFLRNLYDLFLCFHGTIDGFLTGTTTQLLPSTATSGLASSSSSSSSSSVTVSGKGWQALLEHQQYVRMIRKAKKKLDVARRDLESHAEYLEVCREPDGSNDTDYTNLTTINGQIVEEVKSSISTYEENIVQYELKVKEIAASPSFSLNRLKTKLSSYIQWYLSTDEQNDISCFSALRSQPSDHQFVVPSILPVLQISRKLKAAIADDVVLGESLSVDVNGEIQC